MQADTYALLLWIFLLATLWASLQKWNHFYCQRIWENWRRENRAGEHKPQHLVTLLCLEVHSTLTKSQDKQSLNISLSSFKMALKAVPMWIKQTNLTSLYLKAKYHLLISCYCKSTNLDLQSSSCQWGSSQIVITKFQKNNHKSCWCDRY